MSFDQHVNAIQNELQHLNQLVNQEKEKLERLKQDQKNQQNQMTTVLENYQTNQQEIFKHQKTIEKYNHFMAQYLPQIPQETQMQINSEFEKIKQALQTPSTADAHQAMAQNMMAAGNLATMGMPPTALPIMVLQAQAQLGRGMMPGMPAPSPRVQKTNGMPNGIPGLPPNMANGLGAQMAAMQNPMLAAGMPGMAQLQAMAAFTNMQAMGAMPGFNPAQLAAMQASMGMNGMMLPPMSAANSAAAAAALAAGGMVNPLSLSVSTPSRNPSNGGPLSGTRTPQSASNGVNSPRAIIKEETSDVTKKEDVVRTSPTDDSVAVA